MKTTTPIPDNDYEGNKCCIILIAAAGCTFMVLFALIGLYYLIDFIL